MVIVGVDDTFDQSPAQVRQILMVLIKGSNTAWPDESVGVGVCEVLFLVLALLGRFEAIFRWAQQGKDVEEWLGQLGLGCGDWGKGFFGDMGVDWR